MIRVGERADRVDDRRIVGREAATRDDRRERGNGTDRGGALEQAAAAYRQVQGILDSLTMDASSGEGDSVAAALLRIVLYRHPVRSPTLTPDVAVGEEAVGVD